jgi:ATP-dependent exoDNAse (exonuclease V) alpha subunit
MNTNNYKINVMNGEQGKVIGIQDEGVKVEFEDGIQHLFKFSNGISEENLGDIDETSKNDELYVDYLSHSAALSVHRVQGSEYEYVVLYIPEDKSFSNFLNINLLYTAITRTKRSIWIIGNKSTLEKISMTDMSTRYDGLAILLRTLKNEESEKILESFIQVPELSTASHFATALTTTHESYNYNNDDGDDLFALFGVE